MSLPPWGRLGRMNPDVGEEARPSGVANGTVAAVARNATHAFSKPPRDEIVLLAGLGVEGDAHAGVTVRHRSRVAADPAQPNVRQVHLIHSELFAEVGAEGFTVEPGHLGENITTSGIDLLGLPCGTVLRFGPPPAGDGAPAGEEAPAGAVPGTGAVSAAGAVAAVVAAAGNATLDGPTADAVAALVAAAGRDAAGGDRRPAVVVTGLRNPCRQIDHYQGGLLKLVVHRDGDGGLVRKAGVMGVVLRGGPVRPGDPVAVELPPPPHLRLDRV